MAFNKEIADKILEFAKLEPSIPKGQAHDLRLDEFNDIDVKDTANQLITSCQISATIQEDFAGLFIEFRQ
ncbi:TPA: hypothetical protein TVN91_000482 [Streptococcus equi subsp. zooepidemicus]|nr:hypothetical protein [Streptococcus equi subsp. zooepidemicus]